MSESECTGVRTLALTTVEDIYVIANINETLEFLNYLVDLLLIFYAKQQMSDRDGQLS